MSVNDFSALIVEEARANNFFLRVGKRSVEDLPAGDVLVKVHHSSLNYKDALSATGQFGITKVLQTMASGFPRILTGHPLPHSV